MATPQSERVCVEMLQSHTAFVPMYFCETKNLQLKQNPCEERESEWDGLAKRERFFRHLVAYFVSMSVCLSICMSKMFEWQYGKLKIHAVAFVATISHIYPNVPNRNPFVCSPTVAQRNDIDKNERLKNAFKWSMKKLAYLIKLKTQKIYTYWVGIFACASEKRMKRIVNKEKSDEWLSEWKIIEW